MLLVYTCDMFLYAVPAPPPQVRPALFGVEKGARRGSTLPLPARAQASPPIRLNSRVHVILNVSAS